MRVGENDHVFLNSLFHAYDPAKAHEYYERTKKLKGRKKGAGQSVGERRSQQNPTNISHKPKPQQSKEQLKKETELRIAAYKVRLTKLKKILAQLVAEAKKRNADNAGSEETRKKQANTSSSDKEKSGGSSKGSSTAKEKAASKKYYNENKDKISLKKQEKNLKKEIKEVEEKIIKARTDLKTALSKAFNKPEPSKSRPDTKNQNTKRRPKSADSQ